MQAGAWNKKAGVTTGIIWSFFNMLTIKLLGIPSF